MRVRILVVVALLAAVAACGSTANRGTTVALEGTHAGAATTTPSTAPTSGDGAPAAPAAPVPGGATTGATVARGGATASPTGPVPTGPLEVGFLTTATSNASAFGAVLPQTIPERDIINALVAQINAAGGIRGRKVVPIFSDTDTGSTSWDADFAAGCAAFTEDHHVEAVLGYVFGQADTLEQCLQAKRIPHLSATFGAEDAATSARLPYLFNIASPMIERRSILKIDGALDAGILTKTSKLGIVMDGCPSTTSSWKATVKPYIESKGVPIASVFQLGCPRGAADAAAEVGRVGNLVLQMRTNGVDVMMFHAESEGPALFAIANAAEPQGYRPTYIVSSLAQTAVTAEQVPAAQRPNVHGWGWMPLNDTKRPQWPALAPAASRCLALLKKGGIAPSTSVDYAGALFTCDAVFLFEEAMQATGGRTDGPSIAAAIEAMGTKHASALTLDGSSSFGPGHHDAPTTARQFDYQAGCACFVYRAGTRTIR